jgi:hypothetical protein
MNGSGAPARAAALKELNPRQQELVRNVLEKHPGLPVEQAVEDAEGLRGL